MPLPVKIILANRTGLAAVDAAQVSGEAVVVDWDAAIAIATLIESGGATSVSLRAGLEGSLDGDTWFELARFKDNDTLASTSLRIARLVPAGTSAEAAAAATSLTTDEGTGSAKAAPIPPYIRATTFFKTSGGGTPDDTIKVEIVGRNNGGNQ